MSKKLLSIVTFAAVLALATGCSLRSLSISAHHHDRHGYSHRDVVYHDDVYYEPAPVRVYARPGHVCGYDCHNHYWDGTRVVVIGGGHRHGPHCGHHWSGTRWTLVAHKGHGNRHHSGLKVKVNKPHGPRHHKSVEVKVKKSHGPHHHKSAKVKIRKQRH